MPIKSFENYPMAWKPSKTDIQSPVYLSIADLLERDILNGNLSANTKLPPQRELADFLDLNLSTITHAYKICEERGLIHAVVGKGTFVSPNAHVLNSIVDQASQPSIELGTIHPFYVHNRLIRDMTLEVLKKPFSEKLFEYGNPLGSNGQRHIAAMWLQKKGVQADLNNTLIALGVQNALAVILTSLFSPGDKMAVDSYTYPNFISLAKSLRIQLVSIAGDEQGMLPETLETVCKNRQLKGIYFMPLGNNPTNSRMSAERCKEIAEVIKKYNLLAIEDEAYSFLHEEKILPVAGLIPDNCIYISGLSKPICPGLRIAYLCAPRRYYNDLQQGIYRINLTLPPLNIEVATEVIRTGLDLQIIDEKRTFARQRNHLYYTFFPAENQCLDTYCQWQILPAGYSGRMVELQMELKGISVFGAERFSVGETSGNNAIRIATCSPENPQELMSGLSEIRNILKLNTFNTSPLIN